MLCQLYFKTKKQKLSSSLFTCSSLCLELPHSLSPLGVFFLKSPYMFIWNFVSHLCSPTVSSHVLPHVSSHGILSHSKIFNTWIGEGDGNPLQYSCLKNPMDRGAWWAKVHGVAKSQTQLKWHSRLGQLNIVKWSVLLSLICRFNMIPVKMPASYFFDVGKQSSLSTG